MSETYHLIIENGEEKGRKICVPPDGARLGRSSKNDIVLPDPLLSRHHCRLFFKPGGGLWITDLGSANQCLLNDKLVQESALQIGDLVTAGETVLKVVNNGMEHGNTNAPSSASSPAVPPAVDLGFGKVEPSGEKKKLGLVPLILIACAVIILAGLVLLPRLVKAKPETPATHAQPTAPQTLEVAYEKVEATSSNIFFYKLLINKDNTISVQIDDIANNRHVPPKGKTIEDAHAKIADLIRSIQDSGFFSLSEEYRGIQPDVLETCDLTITIGARTHRTKVINRVLPENLADLTKTLEVFAKHELGGWGESVPTAELIQMANNAFLLGKKLYDEKELKYENLASAIKSYQEAEGDLEQVEPKPDFYAEIISNIKDCKAELQAKYDDSNFRVERATKLKDWEEAARELKILMETIPDTSDPRNQDARKNLLDVQRRLSLKK
jgi:pSer/pThr/pTyr-binding forkhead associated (FHA) protein